MARKRKAALPVRSANQGKTASKTTAVHFTQNRTVRQRIKVGLVWAGCKGLLPVGLVCWIIRRGGLAHV